MREREEFVELAEPRRRVHRHGRHVGSLGPIGAALVGHGAANSLGPARFLVGRIFTMVRAQALRRLGLRWTGLFGLGRSARSLGRRGRGPKQVGAGHNIEESPDVSDCKVFCIVLCIKTQKKRAQKKIKKNIIQVLMDFLLRIILYI